MTNLPCLAVTLVLVGCAAQPAHVWEKPGGTQSEFDEDVRYCQFEVLKATQMPDPTLRTIIGQEFDRAQRRKDLGMACMRSRGYVDRPK